MASTESNIHPTLSLSLTDLVDKIQELIDSGRYYKINVTLRNCYNGRCYLGLVYEALVELKLAEWGDFLNDEQINSQYALLRNIFCNVCGTADLLKLLWQSNDRDDNSYQKTHLVLKDFLFSFSFFSSQHEPTTNQQN